MLQDQIVRLFPGVFFDTAEPFLPRAIGFGVYDKPSESPSFPRVLPLPEPAVRVIEYAIYWDYDIQHLYDLEHLWLWLDAGGHICRAEGSWHGQYHFLESLPPYAQPGKHALAGSPSAFTVLPAYTDVCTILAGKDGLLCPEMFREGFSSCRAWDKRVEAYLKTAAFQPEGAYTLWQASLALFRPWTQLQQEIPLWVTTCLTDILRQHSPDTGA